MTMINVMLIGPSHEAGGRRAHHGAADYFQ
jgi:hypothetical protein